MKTLITIILSSFVLFCSCTKLETNHHDIDQNITNTDSDFTIPIETALQSLNSILTDKMTDKPEIKKIQSIESIKDIHTKSTTYPDTLLYIVNFENNSGYAILAADSRIKEEILAFADSGNISTNSILTPYDSTISPIRPTIDYFDEYYNEYYIGSPQESPEAFILDIATSYAQEQILHFTQPGNITDIHIHPGDNTGTMQYPKYVTQYYQNIKSPLLKTTWHQRFPYNYYIPNQKAAGCVPIAISQILAYNEWPTQLVIDNTTIHWDAINSSNFTTNNTPAANEAAKLIYMVHMDCETERWPGGSFTLPYKTAAFLEDYGYINVVKHTGYDENAIITMLDANKPVFIAAVQDYIIWNGHGWVIDGYKKLYEKIEWYDYVSDTYIRTSNEFLGYYLNCNWGNNCSTYVASGIFHSPSGMHYNTWYRIITYDIPNY